MNKLSTNSPFIKYLIALLLFGSNGIVASFITLTSYEIVLLRTFIGSIFLLAIFFITGNRLTFFKHKKQFAFLAVSGVAMGTSWMFLYEAYHQIGVSIASLLYYCGPVIVMALSPLVFKEKLTAVKIIGFITVLGGIFLVNGNSFGSGGNGFGIFCGLMSAVMYSFMVIFNKKAKDITGLENSALQLFISFLTVAVFVGIKQGFAIAVPSNEWVPILILGLVNTGTGCYFYFSSIGKLNVQTVAVCGYLEPLSAVVFSVIFLREAMLPMQIAGAILIIGGAIFAELMGKNKTVVKQN
ncbi:MAG: DMT family transporter [Oscillospiraceae bacterium]|nr:DMT family transporter [Oscillospiraceae bacterium]